MSSGHNNYSTVFNSIQSYDTSAPTRRHSSHNSLTLCDAVARISPPASPLPRGPPRLDCALRSLQRPLSLLLSPDGPLEAAQLPVSRTGPRLLYGRAPLGAPTGEPLREPLGEPERRIRAEAQRGFWFSLPPEGA